MEKHPIKNLLFHSFKTRLTYSAVLLLIALALPRILSGQGESVESYYTIEILVLGTALAPALVRGARRSRSLAYGGLGAVFGYLTVVLLSAATGTLGRGHPVDYSSILPLTASLLYGLTIGVPVAVLASAHRDRSISYSLAGIASLVVPVARLAGGSWGFQGLVGVALASYLTGVSSAVIADKWGRPAGALYYSLMFALITSGPLGIGGSLLLAGAVIGAGSMAGAGALFLLEDGSPAKLGGSWTRSVMPRTRRGIIGASVTAALVIAGALLYMYGFVFWRPYAIVTGSMEPSINRGDLVFIRHVDSVSVGDVVTYRKGRMIVTHRVYQIFDDGVRTKGDANVEPDPYIVPYRDILGRVVLRVPLLGWPLIWANWNRAVRLALVSLSLAGLVLVAFWPRRASGHTG